MHAAVTRAFGQPLTIEPVDLDPPGRGAVRCAVRAVAICHSDLTYHSGGWGGALPAVWGHEAAGEVLETGPGVDRLAVGDRVVITMVRHCGTCPCCSRGLHGVCETPFGLDSVSPIRLADGSRATQGLRTGAFAEQVVVDASQLVPIDDDVGFDTASLLACGVITGYGAVTRTAAMPAGADVAVIGTGGVGLNAVQGAVIGGANRVIAVDLSAGKLAAAEAFGATHAVNSADQDPVAAVRALTGGRGVDFVFVTVGAPQAIDQSFAMLGPGGTSVVVGVPALGAVSRFDPVSLTSGAHRILGSKLAADIHRDIPMLVDRWRDGTLKLEALITRRLGFEDINEAIDTARRGEGLRTVVMIG